MANRMIHTPSYLATANLAEYWTTAAGTSVVNGQYQPNSTTSASALARTFAAASGWTIGMRFKPQGGSDPSFRTLMWFRDGATLHTTLDYQSSTGLFRATRNTSLLLTSTTSVSQYSEVYVEFQTVIDDSNGVAILRINGTTDATLNSSALDTRNAGNASANNISIGGGHTNTANALFDMIYINDNTGGVDDTFWGPIVIPTLVVSNDGNSTGWTPLSGTNASNVDDTTPDDDTSYNHTLTLNAKDTFVMSDTGYSAGTVKGVEWAASMRTDVTSASARVAPVYRIGSTDYVRSDIAPTSSYLIKTQQERQSPATSSAWALSELDGMQVGYQRTAV